ncbi:MAG: hypothetical protein ACTSRK_12280 [Promethearchaeota archaeon]
MSEIPYNKEIPRHKGNVRKSFLKNHPYRVALLRYVVITSILYLLIVLLNSIFSGIFGDLQESFLAIALFGCLNNLFGLFSCFSVPKYMRIRPKPTVPLKQLEHEFNTAYNRYVEGFSSQLYLSKLESFNKIKRRQRILGLMVLGTFLIMIVYGRPINSPTEYSSQLDGADYVFFVITGIFIISMIAISLSSTKREKYSILLARETQRNFLTLYTDLSLHYRIDRGVHGNLGDGIEILTGPETQTPKQQDLTKFKNNAQGILYYQTLSLYFISYSILPLLSSVVIPLSFSTSDTLTLYILIALEIFFILFLLWSIFKTAHGHKMKKKAQLILGIHIATYDEIHSGGGYNDFD